MNDKLVDVTILLDRSGSMMPIRKETEMNVARYITDRANDGVPCKISMVQFDDAYEPGFTAVDAGAVPRWTYEPRGWTALLDALGKSIVATGERLAALPESERPGKVVFVVMTDGEENWSKEYTHSQVREMIENQTKNFNWQFLFLGVGIDAFDIASAVGVHLGGTVNVGKSRAGVFAAYAAASNSTRAYVTGQCVGTMVSDVDYDKAEKTGPAVSNSIGKAAKKKLP